MRAMNVALSALAIALALGGTADAAGTATPNQPAASSSVQTTAPAKHGLFHRIFHRRDAKNATAKTSTSKATSNPTSAGTH